MHMCVCVACPDGTGLPVSQRCKSTDFAYSRMAIQAELCSIAGLHDTIDGRELTNRHNSIRELLMHMCVCVACPDGTGLPVSQRCKSTISPTHEWQSKPLCSIAGLHDTIDRRELANRHNSIRELLMHMCVLLLARMAQGYLYRNSAKALISPTHK